MLEEQNSWYCCETTAVSSNGEWVAVVKGPELLGALGEGQ